jgi:fructose-1,6-bisphosphatase/inositol monophosphatase family enzyme
MLLADRNVAIAAAEAGAAVVRSRYGRSLARLEKAQGDFATAADVEAEKAILASFDQPGQAMLCWLKRADTRDPLLPNARGSSTRFAGP